MNATDFANAVLQRAIPEQDIENFLETKNGAEGLRLVISRRAENHGAVRELLATAGMYPEQAVVCDDCGHVELNYNDAAPACNARDFASRLTEGGIVPHALCPKCEAFMYAMFPAWAPASDTTELARAALALASGKDKASRKACAIAVEQTAHRLMAHGITI